MAVDFNQAISEEKGGGCANLNGVHIFPLPQKAISLDTNKEIVAGASYKVINI